MRDSMMAWVRRVVVALVVGLSLAATGPVAFAQDQGTEPTAFEAGDPDMSKHKENLSGIPYMVAAYLCIWAAIFGYLILLQKRQGKLEGDLAELKAALEAHDRSGKA